MKNKLMRIIACLMCIVMAMAVIGCNDAEVEESAEQGKVSSFSVKYNGAELKIGAKWDSVKGTLGNPLSSIPTGNCGGKGDTYRYDYAALTVGVVHYTDADALIDIIVLKTDAATTDKGIYIGSAKADVLNAYGQPTEENDGALRYENDIFEMVFQIANEKVNSIVFQYKVD